MKIFSYTSSVAIIKGYLNDLPTGQKRGALNKIALAAGVFPSYLSQILKGDRNLNLDQAILIADHIGLDAIETKYFLRATELQRAQTKKLKDQITKEMNDMRSEHDQLNKYIKSSAYQLSPQDEALFYSSWVYAAVRLATALPGLNTSQKISHYLNMSEIEIKKIVQFLLRTGLCENTDKGLGIGLVHTHIDEKSPFVSQHHANWRHKAISRHPLLDSTKEVSYSGVLTLSEDDVLKIRNRLLQCIQEVKSISDPSPPEQMYALNLDWFKVN